MRPYLLTSVSGLGIVLISYAGILCTAWGRTLPSFFESARNVFIVLAVIDFIHWSVVLV